MRYLYLLASASALLAGSTANAWYYHRQVGGGLRSAFIASPEINEATPVANRDLTVEWRSDKTETSAYAELLDTGGNPVASASAFIHPLANKDGSSLVLDWVRLTPPGPGTFTPRVTLVRGATTVQTGSPFTVIDNVNKIAPAVGAVLTTGSPVIFNMGAWQGDVVSFELEVLAADASTVLARQPVTYSSTGSVTLPSGQTLTLNVWAVASDGSKTLASTVTPAVATGAGTSTWTIQGAPKFVNITDVTTLNATIRAAQPGTVITVQNATRPFGLDFGSYVAVINIADPGIVVRLPANQIMMAWFAPQTGGTMTPNIEFQGGIWSYDETQAYYTANGLGQVGSYPGVNGTSKAAGGTLINTSKVSWVGATFENGQNDLLFVNSTDVALLDSNFNYSVDDPVNSGGNTTRFALRRNQTQAGFLDHKICYFSAGREPIFDTVGSQTNCNSYTDGGVTGVFRDVVHADGMQIYGPVYDLDVSFNDITWAEQAMFNAGTGTVHNRTFYKKNSVAGAAQNAIVSVGYDLTYIENDLRPHPYYAVAGSAPQMQMDAVDAAAHHQGRGNRVAIGASFVPPTLGTAVSLGSLTMSGDVGNTLYPEAPRMYGLPWAKRPSRPAFSLTHAVPFIHSNVQLVAHKATNLTAAAVNTGSTDSFGMTGALSDQAVGNWLTCTPGAVATFGLAQTASQAHFQRDGVTITTDTTDVYQLTSADTGHTITCQQRAQSSAGWGLWTSSGNHVSI